MCRFALLWLIALVATPLAAHERPNILIAIADDWSYGDASIDGSTYVRTPAFDRVAREGVRFDNMYTPNAKCGPSRSILLTGRQSWQLGAGANHWSYFPAQYRTWFEALEDMGYHVGSTGKGWAPGVALDPGGLPRRMTGTKYDAITWDPPSEHISNIDYAANFGAFLADREPDEPFVFWYGAKEPHRGFEYGSGQTRGGKSLAMVDLVPAYWPDREDVRNDLLDYAYEVEHFDRHLGRILQMLEAAGELDNTIVIVTSDHGKAFPRVKGQSYYHSNHVPFAMRWPHAIAGQGRRIGEFANFSEVAATLFDLAGLDLAETTMAPVTGASFAHLLYSSSASDRTRNSVVVGKERHDIGRPNDVGYPMRGIITDGFLYIRNYEPTRWPAGDPVTGYLNSDGSPTKTAILDLKRSREKAQSWSLAFGKRPAEELYDLARDPDNVHNLAGEEQHAARMVAMRSAMEARLRAQGDPRMAGEGDQFDRYPYADDQHRDFYNRFMAGEKMGGMHWVNPSDFEEAGAYAD